MQPGVESVEDVVFNAIEKQETPGYGSRLGHQRATDMIEISRNKMKYKNNLGLLLVMSLNYRKDRTRQDCASDEHKARSMSNTRRT